MKTKSLFAKTKSLFKLSAAVCALLAACAPAARAQERDVPKVEVGAQFSSLSLTPPDAFFGGTENRIGFGGRVTYNLTHYFAVEAEGTLYPSKGITTLSTGGRAMQGQFGVKVGKRWERFGVFAKARPGLISFGEALGITERRIESGGQVFTFPVFIPERKTHFAADVGGVLEFYASRRTMVRFDFGDTIIRYGERETLGSLIIIGPDIQRPIIRLPSETKHNFQFTAGIGYRFGGGAEPGVPGAQKASDDAEGFRRFEAGIQFSSLLFDEPDRVPGGAQVVDDRVNAESGFGGWFGVNLSRSLALEASGNFFPRKSFTNETTGGYPSQLQAGVKAGRRWERWGLFAKARPGFVSFSNSLRFEGTDTIVFDGQTFVLPRFERGSRTYFSTDLGAVVELYPSRRLVTRFDFGDTIIRYGERETFGIVTSQGVPRLPAETKHNFQFTAGLGFRF